MIIIISIGKFLLRLIYCILKLFPTQNQVVFLSRQSDTLPADYSEIINEIKEMSLANSHSNSHSNYKIVTLVKRQEKDTKNFLASGIENAQYLLKQMRAIATSKVAVVDGYCIPVSILKHKKSLVIIQIWHAIGAIKKFGLQTLPLMDEHNYSIAKALKMHQGYSYVVAPSQACGEFFSEAFGVDMSQIEVLGTPHLDYLYYGENNKKDEILAEFPALNGKKVILYVPTYRSGGRNERILEIMKDLRKNVDFDNYALIVKLHPVDYSFFVNDARIKGHVYDETDNTITITDAFSAEELLSITDCVVTDYSSLAFDAGLLGLPFFFYVYDIDEYKEKTGLNIDVESEYGKYTSRDVVKLVSMLDENYDKAYMNKFIEKYISCYDGRCTERLSRFIINMMDPQ